MKGSSSSKLIALLALLAVWAPMHARAEEVDTCPPAEEILPCTCNGEGMSCSAVLDQRDFDISLAALSSDTIYRTRGFWLQDTAVEHLTYKHFRSLKVQSLNLDLNQLSSVDLSAFSSSGEVLAFLSLFHNDLEAFPFHQLKDFPLLRVLDLAHNRLSSVDDGALGTHTSLEAVFLNDNRIRSIGQNAFGGLRGLRHLDLTHNLLKELDVGSLAFLSSQPFTVDLDHNHLSHLPVGIFQGKAPIQIDLSYNNLETLEEQALAPLVESMTYTFGGIHLHENPFDCESCNNAWLARNKTDLMRVLWEFQCDDSRTLEELHTQDFSHCQ